MQCLDAGVTDLLRSSHLSKLNRPSQPHVPPVCGVSAAQNLNLGASVAVYDVSKLIKAYSNKKHRGLQLLFPSVISKPRADSTVDLLSFCAVDL